jgi:hypothetical protein
LEQKFSSLNVWLKDKLHELNVFPDKGTDDESEEHHSLDWLIFNTMVNDFSLYEYMNRFIIMIFLGILFLNDDINCWLLFC